MRKSIEWIANIGVTHRLSKDYNRKIRATNVLSFCFGLIVLSYSALFFVLKLSFLGRIALPFAAGYFVVLGLNKVHLHTVSRLLVMFLFIAVVYVFSTTMGRDCAVHYWYIPAMVTPFMIFTFREKRYLVSSSLLAFFALCFLRITQFKYSLVGFSAIGLFKTYFLAVFMIGGAFFTAFSLVFFLVYQLEKALLDAQNSEKSYRDIFDHVPVGLVKFDRNLKLKTTNAALSRMLGYSKYYLKNLNLKDILHPEDQDELDLLDKQISFEKRLVHQSGRILWARLTAHSVQVDEEEEPQYLAMIKDITEIHKKDEEVRNKQQFYETILENIPLAIFIKDCRKEFTVTYWNETAERILGRPRENAIGKSAKDMLPPDEAKISFIADQAVMNAGVLVDQSIVYHNVPERGKVPFHTIKVPVRDRNEQEIKYLLVIMEDLTDKLLAQERLKQAQLISFQSSRLASLGEMAGSIAHEINNPIGVIQGKASQLLRLIRQNQWTVEKGTEQLEKIISETDRIVKIIKGLRAFSRDGEQDPFALADLKVLLNDVLVLCSERFKNHNVKLEVNEFESVDFECRAVQLVQVLTNLLNNAFDAVSVLSEKWVRLDVEYDSEIIKISITDSGHGIPHDVAEKLMEPFFTTKEVGKGTGLGLSISKGIIEDHGGEFWLDRSSSHTKFVIKLPLTQRKRTTQNQEVA